MKIEITSEDYKDYYEAVDWDPVVFEKLLRHLDYDFGNLVVKGDFDLSNTRITHFVGVRVVVDDLWFYKTPIRYLRDLEEVGGILDLDHTPIESLGDLKIVRGSLWLIHTPIESLGVLEKVETSLNLAHTPMAKKYSEEEIAKMVEVDGSINI